MPARWHSIGYRTAAVERIAELSGNRPWEICLACYLVTAVLEQHNYILPDMTVTAEQVDSIVNLQLLKEDVVGRTMLERYTYLLDEGVNPAERRVLDKLTTGVTFDKSDHPSAERLQEYAVIRGMAINGAMLHDVLAEKNSIEI